MINLKHSNYIKNNEILYWNSPSFIWNIYNDRLGIKDQVYKKKTFKRKKIILINFNIADLGNRFIFVMTIKAYFSFVFSLFFGQSN